MADTTHTETLSLNYEEIKWSYSKSKDAEDSFDFTAERDEDDAAALLLPAVQLVHHSATHGEPEEDGFDFKGERDQDETVGLLLPAVQQVREGSSLPPDQEDQAVDSFQFDAEPEGVLIGLLLPAVQAAEGPMEAEDRGLTAKDDGETAYEYKLDGVMISSYDVNGSADADHDRWIDVLSTDWGTSKPAAEANLRSDGELVQAVSEADMGGDFIL